ncbi:nitroreductase family protein [Peloplasma aerotolerans]|jgi:nitroreductase|uniref:Nitroreductase family protein n=1 Tax=Peloplasma aerotolerans TaxID=3044389 RepID=A0AAW6U273_9MOLU|nr:nitroreductase family protein [Mariniplasma sp. M4Ah]MDI6452078.1 nitroreductase family protein [Mariniplasma sp. M4Ah]MDR4969242.1 nitroreductase family protein [Acholeplasmataceae bacterium]
MSKITERRSIRIYDPRVKISKDEMTEILEKATRAPSSMNMQPWRFIVIESDEAKEKLRPVLYGNVSQLETSAAMIVILNDLKKYEFAEKIYDKAVKAGVMPIEVREKQLRSISNMVNTVSADRLEKTGLIDGGLVAMQLMLIAKEYGYDTCSIGGFRHELLVKSLGLDDQRYKPVMIVSIGKKAEDGYRSVRLDINDITTWM